MACNMRVCARTGSRIRNSTLRADIKNTRWQAMQEWRRIITIKIKDVLIRSTWAHRLIIRSIGMPVFQNRPRLIHVTVIRVEILGRTISCMTVGGTRRQMRMLRFLMAISRSLWIKRWRLFIIGTVAILWLVVLVREISSTCRAWRLLQVPRVTMIGTRRWARPWKTAWRSHTATVGLCMIIVLQRGQSSRPLATHPKIPIQFFRSISPNRSLASLILRKSVSSLTLIIWRPMIKMTFLADRRGNSIIKEILVPNSAMV